MQRRLLRPRLVGSRNRVFALRFPSYLVLPCALDFSLWASTLLPRLPKGKARVEGDAADGWWRERMKPGHSTANRLTECHESVALAPHPLSRPETTLLPRRSSQ